MDLVKAVEAHYMRDQYDHVAIGDRVSASPDQRRRPQTYRSTKALLSRRGRGLNETITVRRMSYGVGVERVFPIHSPRIEKIEVVRKGRVRRAKLYYLRDRVGKRAKIREKLVRKQEQN